MRWIASTALLAGCLWLTAALPSPEGSKPGDDVGPQVVKIVAVYGPRTLHAGELGNYRVRVAEGATRPIEYRWNFGDETLAEGILVAHHFSEAGRYVVTVTARNKYGRDTDTLVVAVSAPGHVTTARDEDTVAVAPVAEKLPKKRPEPSIKKTLLESSVRSTEAFIWPRSGYTWVIATHLHREAAEQDAHHYRDAGYRTGIVVNDRGPGSTAYRIVIGYFSTPEAALQARRLLPADRPGGLWLLDRAAVAGVSVKKP